MEQKAKWLKIGQICKFDGKNGEFESISLENENLKEFVGFLKNFGQEQIGDLDAAGIRAAQKLKVGDPNRLDRIQIYRFDKKPEDYQPKVFNGKEYPGCPEFVIADLLIKLND